ncbi:hypothetical protein P4H39_30055 [Paenibacillus lautus]|uniref:hypothetical protein n=1 Tax=Paenibacillus lautus TaxID=1401 RepID=UPI002DB5C20B|nr:hypothetical protein [Paenibacillus lautus]MEC0206859.1 hypothetical protein [Paenibacillus lautus]
MRNYVPIQAPTIENPSPDSSYTYHEYLPSPPLTPYVACYWTLDYLRHFSSRFIVSFLTVA